MMRVATAAVAGGSFGWTASARMTTAEYPRFGGGYVSALVWWNGESRAWDWRLVKGNGQWMEGQYDSFGTAEEAIAEAEKHLRRVMDPMARPRSGVPLPEWTTQ